MRMFRIMLLTAMLGTFVFSGCYTMLKHPTLSNDARLLSKDDAVDHVKYQSDCIQCHSNSADYYNETLSYGQYYSNNANTWLYYYDSPWWVQPYYYSNTGSEGEGGVPNPRQFGRRGVHTPDTPQQATGAASSGAGYGGTVGTAKRTTESDSSDEQTPAAEPDNRRSERRSSGEDSSRTRTRKDN